MNLIYSLHSLLIDVRWVVLALSVVLVAIYGRVLLRAAFPSGAPATRPSTRSSQIPPIRRPQPKPAVPPAAGEPKPPAVPENGKQEVLPDTIGAGMAGHQKAGAAKTVKLPSIPPRSTDGRVISDAISALAPTVRADKPKTTNGGATTDAAPAKDADAEALLGLFGGDAPPTETNTGAIRRKASRLEELGFHHGIDRDQPIAAGDAPKATPAAPRSSTAELTSILERIDKFLAEDTPAATPSTKLSEAKPAETAPAALVAPAAEVVAKPVDKAPEPPKPVPTAAVEAAPSATDKPDPNRKTQPLWARSDAQDEDLDKPKDGGKDGKIDNGQQRLF